MKRWKRVWAGTLLVLSTIAILGPVGAQEGQGETALGDGAYTPLLVGNGVLAVLAPTGWAFVAQGLANNTLAWVNDAAMVDRSPADATYAPGEASLALTLLPVEDLERYGLPSDSVGNALLGLVGAVRASAMDRTGASQMNWTLPEVVPASAGRPEVAQALMGVPGKVDRRLMLWPVSEDLWALLVVSSAPGELANQTEPAEVMLRSVQLDGTIEALRAGLAEPDGAS